VLNRYPDPSDSKQTIHIAKHVFPRQFGLHNAFTSKVDSRETAYPFKDYTLRDAEIKMSEGVRLARLPDSIKSKAENYSKIPKRLRGLPLELILRFRQLHNNCSYVELLRHYCRAKVCIL
jgi:telomerase reverse transcriptase